MRCKQRCDLTGLDTLMTPVVIWRCFLKTRVVVFLLYVWWPGTSMIQLYVDQRQEKAWATHWLSWRQRSGWLTWQACRPTTTRCATRTPAITISPVASPKAWTAAIKHQSLLTRLHNTWCLIHPRLRKSLNRKRLKFISSWVRQYQRDRSLIIMSKHILHSTWGDCIYPQDGS